MLQQDYGITRTALRCFRSARRFHGLCSPPRLCFADELPGLFDQSNNQNAQPHRIQTIVYQIHCTQPGRTASVSNLEVTGRLRWSVPSVDSSANIMVVCKRKYLLGVSIVFVLVAASVSWMLCGHPAPVTVVVSISITHQKGSLASVSLKRHGGAPVRLMCYIVEEASEQGWRRISSDTFKSNTALPVDQDYTFIVSPPAGASGWRLRVQYGLGTHGIQLWQERAQLAWRTGRIRAALRFEEWEACESVSEVVR